MSYTKDLVDQYGSIEQAAHAQAAYLHDHGLFHAEDVINCLLKQRDELLEALQELTKAVEFDRAVRGGEGAMKEPLKKSRAAIYRALDENKE